MKPGRPCCRRGHASPVWICRTYLVPLIIVPGHGISTPESFTFWLSFLGALLLLTSSLWVEAGLYGAGSAPDVAGVSYALVAREPFFAWTCSDIWTLSLLFSVLGSP